MTLKKYRKIYLFPVIVLGLLTILEVSVVIYLLTALGAEGPLAEITKTILDFWTFFWPCLFIVEIIIYCVIRKKPLNRLWVLLHTWFTLGAFFLMWIVFALISLSYEHLEDKSWITTISIFRRLFFWFLVIVGHIFFILTIVKAFQKQSIETNEAPGLLDEFVG